MSESESIQVPARQRAAQLHAQGTSGFRGKGEGGWKGSGKGEGQPGPCPPARRPAACTGEPGMRTRVRVALRAGRGVTAFPSPSPPARFTG